MRRSHGPTPSRVVSLNAADAICWYWSFALNKVVIWVDTHQDIGRLHTITKRCVWVVHHTAQECQSIDPAIVVRMIDLRRDVSGCGGCALRGLWWGALGFIRWFALSGHGLPPVLPSVVASTASVGVSDRLNQGGLVHSDLRLRAASLATPKPLLGHKILGTEPPGPNIDLLLVVDAEVISFAVITGRMARWPWVLW